MFLKGHCNKSASLGDSLSLSHTVDKEDDREIRQGESRSCGERGIHSPPGGQQWRPHSRE